MLRAAGVAVAVLATAGEPGAVAASLRRAGRLDRVLVLRTPAQDGRAEILRLRMTAGGVAGAGGAAGREALVQSVAEGSAGYSPADLENLCREVCCPQRARLHRSCGGSCGALRRAELLCRRTASQAVLHACRARGGAGALVVGDADWADFGAALAVTRPTALAMFGRVGGRVVPSLEELADTFPPEVRGILIMMTHTHTYNTPEISKAFCL
jgi:hypothetical protein